MNKKEELEAKRKQDFITCASSFGLTPDHLGKGFVYNGFVFTIIGANPDCWKYPIIAKREDGKRFRFHPKLVRENLTPNQ